MKKAVLTCLVLLLCSCATQTPSIVVVTATPSITPTIEPTATKIPLADINLEDVLVQSGDLPSGYGGAQIRDTVGPIFDDMPLAAQIVNQELSHGEDHGGRVIVFLYEDSDELERAYLFIMDEILMDINKEIDGIGELAHGYGYKDSMLGKIHRVAVLFRRCNSVVHISLSDTYDLEDGVAYAKRLDKRLQPLVCP